MTTVARLTIEMAADLARLQKDMSQAKGMVGGAMDGVSKAVDFAKKAFIALGGAASITAFAGAIKGAIDAAAALDDLSKKTGASVQALSRWQEVGKLSGTSAETVAGAVNKLTKNLDGTSKVTAEARAAIEALGLNYQSFIRLAPEQRFNTIAKAMDNFADGSGKSAAAMALFGKTGADLLPFIGDLNTFGEINARITAEQAEAAADFGDRLEMLKVSGGEWKRELALGMAPALATATRAFVDVINGAGGLRDELGALNNDGSIERWTRGAIVGLTYLMDIFAGVKRVVQSVGEYFGAVAAQITIFFSSVGAAAKKFFSGDFRGALDEVKAGMRQADAVAADLKDTLSEVWSEETVGQKIRARWSEIESMGKAAEAAKPQVDMRAQFDGNATAAKKQVEEMAAIEDVTRQITDAGLDQIAAMHQRTKVTFQQTAAIREQVETVSEWDKAMESVFTGLTDALFRAFEEGKGFMQAFRDTLKNTFNSLILRPTIEAIMRPIGGAIGGILTGARAGLGGIISSGGGSGGGSGILGNLGTAIGLGGSMLGAGLGYGLAAYGASATLGGTLAGAGAMISGGLAGGMAGMGSLMAGIGAIAGVLGPIALGIALLVKGFTRGPKKITEEGISGQIVGGDIAAEAYAKWKQSGSWFVSGRKGIKYSDLGEEASLALEQTTAAIFGGMAEYSKALGLPVELLAQVNYEFKAAKGKTEEETEKNLAAAFEGYRQALAGQFAAVLEPFRNAGETLVETFERLVAIQAASETLNTFGGVFSRIARLSVEAREELIGFAGGIEALVQKAQAFVGAYYSEGERAAISAKAITDQLAALGIDPATLRTKTDFRALVEGTDVSTTDGRRQLDALLTIAQAFAPVADYLATSGGSLAELAGQAPQGAVLEAMFADSQLATQYAEQTATGVAAVETAVTSVEAAVAASGDNIARGIDALRVALEEALQRNSREIVGAIEATA